MLSLTGVVYPFINLIVRNVQPAYVLGQNNLSLEFIPFDRIYLLLGILKVRPRAVHSSQLSGT